VPVTKTPPPVGGGCVNFFLCFITLGLWLPVWLLLLLGQELTPWRCVRCGSRARKLWME
jgi:hypothetical protein